MLRFIVFDFDGIFNDGNIIFDNNGNIIKQYNTKDGVGIKLLRDNGFHLGVISGYKENASQRNILTHLNFSYISLATSNKLEKLKEWCRELNITLDEVAYMGDDINDLEVMKHVKVSGCPKDAHNECLKIANFISTKKGGELCVREFCEYIIDVRDKKTISGLICVKYNSSRLPFKNFRKFGNTTLLDIKIQKLLELEFLDHVIVNTESEFIIKYISKKYNNSKLKIIKRDEFYSGDTVENLDFCRYVVNSIEDQYVLYSPVTMPFIRKETYNNMYDIINNGNYDSVILAADGKQGKGHSYEKHNLCFGASLMKKEDIVTTGDFIGNQPYYMICKERERIDIDYPDEFNIALYHYFNTDAKYGFENVYSLQQNPIYNLNEISPITEIELSMNKVECKIIDVTIRDGGFNNNWNWEIKTVTDMLKCASDTNIEYFEIGYICNRDCIKDSDGPFKNVSFDLIDSIVDDVKPTCKISVLFDAWRYDTDQLLERSKTNVDLIRVVTYMDNDKLLYAINQCRKVKKLGYLVSLNIMCMSYFTKDILDNIKSKIIDNIEIFDYIYFADTYGNMEPRNVNVTFSYIKDIKNYKKDIKIGFHIHNNGQIGMANMIASLDHVDIFDASYYGMGRGMGNIRLEDAILFLIIKRNYSLNIQSFLNYLEENASDIIKCEVRDTLLGLLNIHPYRIKDFKNDTCLYEIYLSLKNLSIDKKYDYNI